MDVSEERLAIVNQKELKGTRACARFPLNGTGTPMESSF
jgi:hypothetical protein